MPYADPEKRKQYHRDYYRTYMRNWARANPEKNAENVRKWREKNPEGLLAQLHRRKAKKRDAPGNHHTAKERKALFAEYLGLCAYCTRPAKSLDHVVPLAKGGTNAIENCVPACKYCNSSKGAKKLIVWMCANPIPGARSVPAVLR